MRVALRADQLPRRRTPGSLGYDLTVSRAVTIPAQSLGAALTGVALAQPLPDGVALLVLPRSSLAYSHGLIIPNSPGLVDQDYNGEIAVALYNLRASPVRLEPGCRIAQLVWARIETPELYQLERTFRGRDGGFGSTGV